MSIESGEGVGEEIGQCGHKLSRTPAPPGMCHHHVEGVYKDCPACVLCGFLAEHELQSSEMDKQAFFRFILTDMLGFGEERVEDFLNRYHFLCTDCFNDSMGAVEVHNDIFYLTSRLSLYRQILLQKYVERCHAFPQRKAAEAEEEEPVLLQIPEPTQEGAEGESSLKVVTSAEQNYTSNAIPSDEFLHHLESAGFQVFESEGEGGSGSGDASSANIDHEEEISDEAAQDPVPLHTIPNQANNEEFECQQPMNGSYEPEYFVPISSFGYEGVQHDPSLYLIPYPDGQYGIAYPQNVAQAPTTGMECEGGTIFQRMGQGAEGQGIPQNEYLYQLANASGEPYRFSFPNSENPQQTQLIQYIEYPFEASQIQLNVCNDEDINQNLPFESPNTGGEVEPNALYYLEHGNEHPNEGYSLPPENVTNSEKEGSANQLMTVTENIVEMAMQFALDSEIPPHEFNEPNEINCETPKNLADDDQLGDFTLANDNRESPETESPINEDSGDEASAQVEMDKEEEPIDVQNEEYDQHLLSTDMTDDNDTAPPSEDTHVEEEGQVASPPPPPPLVVEQSDPEMITRVESMTSDEIEEPIKEKAERPCAYCLATKLCACDTGMKSHNTPYPEGTVHESWQCERCPYETTLVCERLCHVSQHKVNENMVQVDDNQAECKLCGVKMDKAGSVIRHMNYEHVFVLVDHMFRCLKCDGQGICWERVVATETRIPLTYPCIYCKRRYPTMTRWNRHMMRNHEHQSARAQLARELEKENALNPSLTSQQLLTNYNLAMGNNPAAEASTSHDSSTGQPSRKRPCPHSSETESEAPAQSHSGG